MDERIKFYSQNINLLPPKRKSTFRHLKQGIQEFHRKYVLVPEAKAANNVVVVCRLQYINILKQELNGTKAYENTSTDEKSVVNFVCLFDLILNVPVNNFSVMLGRSHLFLGITSTLGSKCLLLKETTYRPG